LPARYTREGKKILFIFIHPCMRDVHNGMGQTGIWQVNGDDGEHTSKFMDGYGRCIEPKSNNGNSGNYGNYMVTMVDIWNKLLWSLWLYEEGT
jgi:hypothetical protein